MRKSALFVTGMFIAFALIIIVSPAVRAAAVELTYANFFPAAHVQSQLAEAWCREVENRTNGKIKIKYYPAQKLIKAKGIYEAVAKGRADLCLSILAYTRERFPLMAAVDLPLGYTSGKIATAVSNEFYRRFKPKELSDTRVMYLHNHGPGLVNTRGKPVRNLDDMMGLKFRAHGTSARVVEALGGIPISRPMPETYKMLAEGVVAGAMYPLEAHKGWKLADVIDYTTASFSIAYTTTFFVVMNKKKWHAFPKDIKRIINDINNEWLVKHAEAWDTSDEGGLKHFLNTGNQIIGLDENESRRWKQRVAPIIEQFVEDLNKAGFKGREIVDFTVRTLNEML